MHVLLYLETPPHLRRHLFALHPNLRTAGALPSLDMPHHMRADEWCEFREGVTVEHDDGGGNSGNGVGEDHARRKIMKTARTKERVGGQDENSPRRTLVDAGLQSKVVIEDEIPPKTRVTVRFSNTTASTSAAGPSPKKRKPSDSGDIPAEAVGPDTPREGKGYYWGYNVRRASCVSGIFTECPYDDGYDLSFGTSERGVSVESLLRQQGPRSHDDDDDDDDPSDEQSSANPSTPENRPLKFKHLLLAFGGPHGLEVAIRNDAVLTSNRRADRTRLTVHATRSGSVPASLEGPHTPISLSGSSDSLATFHSLGSLPSPFDYWVDVCPGQGSRTIRTVEAVWIALAQLREFVQKNRA